MATRPSTVPFTYKVDNDAVTITKYTGPGGALTIPSEIDGLPVTTIDIWALDGCKVTSLEIPASVTSISVLCFGYFGGADAPR